MFQQKKAILDFWVGDWTPFNLGNVLKLWQSAKDIDTVQHDANNVRVLRDKKLGLIDTILKSYDFSIDTNGLVGLRLNVSGNNDGIGGLNNWFKGILTGGNATHHASEIPVFTTNRLNRVSGKYWFPIGNIKVDSMSIRTAGTLLFNTGIKPFDTINSFNTELRLITSQQIRCYPADNNNITVDADNDEMLLNEIVVLESPSEDFYQFNGVALPSWNGIDRITFNGISEFLDGTKYLSYFQGFTSGSISWVVGGILATNRLKVFTMGNTGDDTESFRCGINSANKIYYFIQFGAIMTQLSGTLPTIQNDIVQIRSVGGVIKMYINGIEDIIVVTSGVNLGEWFNKPNVNTLAMGALIRIATTYSAEVLKSVIITKGETDQQLFEIYKYLKNEF